jgi:hypothetical protein
VIPYFGSRLLSKVQIAGCYSAGGRWGVGGERWVVSSTEGLWLLYTEGNVGLYCWDLRLATA